MEMSGIVPSFQVQPQIAHPLNLQPPPKGKTQTVEEQWSDANALAANFPYKTKKMYGFVAVMGFGPVTGFTSQL
jgi:hypothetical protein